MKTSIKLFIAVVAMSAITIVACEKADLVNPSTVVSTERKKPTPPTSIVWTQVATNNIDMHITADTTHCGVLVLRWDAQPNCQTYYVYDLASSSLPYACAPFNTTTNALYYQYGWGCSINPSSTVQVIVSGEYRDSATATMYTYNSTVKTIQTGRGQWNCN